MNKSRVDIIRSELKALARNNKERIDEVPLGELGIDSLDFFEFILHMDEAYGIKLHEVTLDNKLTLSTLIDRLTT